MKRTMLGRIFLKTTCLVLSISFICLEIAWAAPATTNVAAGDTLSTQRAFQAAMMDAGTNTARENLFDAIALQDTVCAIAKFRLGDPAHGVPAFPLSALQANLQGELGAIADGVNLSQVHDLPDRIVQIGYERGDDEYDIYVAETGNEALQEVSGMDQIISVSDRYAIRAVPREYFNGPRDDAHRVDWTSYRYAEGDRNEIVDRANSSIRARRLPNGRFAVYSGGLMPPRSGRTSGEDVGTGPMTVDLAESYSRDDALRQEEKGIDERLEAALPEFHDQLMQRIADGDTPFIGQLSPEVIRQLVALADEWVESGSEHIVFVGEEIDSSAQFLLQALTSRDDWNEHARLEVRPRVHFIEGYDPASIASLQEKVRANAVPADKVRIVRVGTPTAQSEKVIAELTDGVDYSIEDADPATFNANTIGLLAVGLVTDPLRIKEIYRGARDSQEDWSTLRGDAIASYGAYRLALASVRMAQTGKNVSVFMAFSMTLRQFSVYLAQLFNRETGTSRTTKVWFTGENLTYLHSTQQAQAQSVDYQRDELSHERARRGFISLIFLNAAQEGDVAVEGPVHPLLRGFGLRFVTRITRAAYRLSMQLARRPIVDVDFNAKTPEDIGRMLFFAQVSAAMAGKLAESDPAADAVPALEAAVESGMERTVVESHEDGAIDIDQNILTATTEGDRTVLGGIIGRVIEEEGVDSETFTKLAEVLLKIPKKLESKVLKAYRSGTELDHLNPHTIKREASGAAAMAELYKGKKRIYAISIGGSTTGPIMADVLGLDEGPEIVEVQSYDADMMSEIRDDIADAADPTNIGIVVISKSGVTTEVDLNGWSIIHALRDALLRKEMGEHEIFNHVLIITDPQVGTLHQKVRDEGWRTLAHPVLIGGRWSMFSSVGLFYYFLKGGKMDDLMAAVRQLHDQQWDRALAAALATVAEQNDLFDPAKAATPDQRKEAVRVALQALSQVPGVWEGVLDYIVNTFPTLNRDTDVAFALNGAYANFISHRTPFEPQLRAESKGKPGIRFYAAAIWGWNAITNVWNRVLTNDRVYVTLFGIAPEAGTAETPAARMERAAWDAMRVALTAKDVPYMAVRTGPMSAANLLEIMQLQYRRLAVDMALYEPMDHKSEGQSGVELTKNIARAEIAAVGAEIKRLADGDPAAEARMRLEGIDIPEMAADQIEHRTEVPMDLGDFFTMEGSEEKRQELIALVEGLIRGDRHSPGLLSQHTLDAIKERPNNELPRLLRDLLLKKFLEMHNVQAIYLDGDRPSVSGHRWIIRSTSLENHANLEHGTANGSNVGIYERVDGRLTLRVAIQVLWGSSVRATISDGTKTQDFKLKGDGATIVEIDRPGEHNAVVMNQKGSYLALGGLSSERPQSFRNFERDIMRPSLNTSIRFSDAGSADTSLMMNKQGLIAAWMTTMEAYELSMIMEAAGGMVMYMDPAAEGLKHVRDMALEERYLEGRKQIYVYAGNPDTVRQVQAYIDYLGVHEATAGPEGEIKAVVLDILRALGDITPGAPASLKAKAIMWTLRLKEGIEALPPPRGLSGAMRSLVERVSEEMEMTLERLDVKGTIAHLVDEYVSLSPEMRERRVNDFILLGHRESGILCHPGIPAGEELKLVYDLHDRFDRTSSWTLLEETRLIANREGYESISASITEAQQALKESYSDKMNSEKRLKTDQRVLERVPFGETFASYLEKSAGVPEQVHQALNLEDRRVPSQAINAMNRMVDVYMNDQVLGNALDPRVQALVETLSDEKEIFYLDSAGFQCVHSLHWIRQNLDERKSGAEVNQTGDVSSRLDNIYNHILIFFAQPLVDIIISEEEPDPVEGTRGIAPDAARLLMFIDPIDGSSQIKEAGTFGMIFTIGILMPGQRLSDFDPRMQTLCSFDVQFGFPRTLISFVNRSKIGPGASAETRNRPEVVQFELTATDDGLSEAFRKQLRYPKLGALDVEPKQWRGLVPNSMPGKGLGIAMGGSFIDSRADDGHREVVAWLMDTYGYDLAYTGALVNDIRKLLRSSPDTTQGILHTYGPTGKHVNGRFRLTFELWHYALMFEALGGEVCDGLKPMLDHHMSDTRPSAITKPFYGGSRWVTKIVMAWRNRVKENFEGKGLSEDDMAKEFERFIHEYERLSKRLVADLVVHFGHDLPESLSGELVVRKALLRVDGDISDLIYERENESHEELVARVAQFLLERKQAADAEAAGKSAPVTAAPRRPQPPADPFLDAVVAALNNARAKVAATAKNLLDSLTVNYDGVDRGALEPAVTVLEAASDTTDQTTSQPAAALVHERVEDILRMARGLQDEGRLSSEDAVKVIFLLKNLEKALANSIHSSAIGLARAAMADENDTVILGIGTGWIPGMDEVGRGTQHDAMNLLLREIERLPETIRSGSEGAVHFEVVMTAKNDLVEKVMRKKDQTGARLSNIVMLDAQEVLFPYAKTIQGLATGERPFLAAVDSQLLRDWQKKYAKKEGVLNTEQLNIEILKMLSVTLEMALDAGRERPDIPLVKDYDQAMRLLILLPEAKPEDYDKLLDKHAAEAEALSSA